MAEPQASAYSEEQEERESHRLSRERTERVAKICKSLLRKESDIPAHHKPMFEARRDSTLGACMVMRITLSEDREGRKDTLDILMPVKEGSRDEEKAQWKAGERPSSNHPNALTEAVPSGSAAFVVERSVVTMPGLQEDYEGGRWRAVIPRRPREEPASITYDVGVGYETAASDLLSQLSRIEQAMKLTEQMKDPS